MDPRLEALDVPGSGPSAHRYRRAGASGSLAVLLAVAAGGVPGSAAMPDQGEHSLGHVHFPVSCSLPAQAEFDHAVALLHHMTYPQARESFEHVAALDPRCAMAHWGVAMTLFQPLWPTRPGPAELRHGWNEVRTAKELGPPSERERLFVAAAEAFFVDPESPDYWGRIARWESAMARIAAAFPDDEEAAAFHALAILATAPPDERAREHSDRAAEILLRIRAHNPDHPGAMHYLIHANDIPGREHEQLEITRGYEAVAPDNPHALHMPTHIYTRLGDWESSIRGNLRAADAALRYPAGEHGELVWDEFPHAVEYLVYAYLQRGDDGRAAHEIERLRATPRIEPTFKTAFHAASTAARFALERQAWGEAEAIVPRATAGIDWDRFAWPEAISCFAHGLGAAKLGHLATARAASERLGVLEERTGQAGEQLFTRTIRVLGLELQGWIEQADGQPDAALASLRAAAELERTTPKHAVTPGPTLPAAEQLGDLLLARGLAAEALAAYRAALEQYPRRFNGLVGAARAARAAGDDAAAGDYYRELLAVAAPDGSRSALAEAKAFRAAAP